MSDTTTKTPGTTTVTPTVTQEPTQPDVTDVLRGEPKDSIADQLLTTRPKRKAKDKPAEPANPAAPAEPVTPEPAKAAVEPAPAAPAAPAEPEPVKVRRQTRQPQGLTTDDVTKIIEGIAPKLQPAAPATPAAAAYELPDSLKRNAQIYSELEKLNPEKYRDIGRKQAEFLQKETQRAIQWEDNERQRLIAAGQFDPNNPPQYNSDDPVHAKFYRENQPDISPDDWDEAKFEIKFSQRAEKVFKPKLDDYERRFRDMDAKPRAQEAVNQYGSNFIASLNPGVEVSDQSFKKWADENPLEFEIAIEVQKQERPIVHAASLLWDGAELDEKNPSHIEAARYFNQFEGELQNYNEPIENDRGQTWVPAGQYAKMNASQQARHFTTTKEALVNFISLESAKKVKSIAKQQVEIIEKRAAKLGYVKPQPSPAAATTPAAAPAKPAPALASPSVASGAPTPPSSGTAPNPTPEKNSPMDKLWGTR